MVAGLRTIPILNYHSVSGAPSADIAPFSARPEDLGRHLDLIVSGGHPALTVSELVDLLDRDVAPPPGAVVITFDDGFEDNLATAAPMLAARGLPATVYVTTGYLPGCPAEESVRPPGRMIPFDRLAELEAAGIEVGSHSHSHRQLDLLSRSAAADDIRRGKELLEGALGHPVASFAYPHGHASRWVQDEVQRCGFRSACGVRNAFSHPADNRWLLARLTVMDSTTCARVEQWLSGTGAPVASRREHVRTKVWREVRRIRSSRPSFLADDL